MQEISRKDLAIIYKSNICDGWRKKIADTLIEQVDAKVIEVSDAVIKAAYSEASTEQKKLIEKYFEIRTEKKIIDKIKDLDDIFEFNDVDETILPFKSPKNAQQKYLNACALIPLIVNAYNEGEELNWNNGSSKYLPYYKKTSLGWVFCSYDVWYSTSDGSASHHYKSLELLLDAVKKFDGIYVDFFSYKG